MRAQAKHKNTADPQGEVGPSGDPSAIPLRRLQVAVAGLQLRDDWASVAKRPYLHQVVEFFKALERSARGVDKRARALPGGIALRTADDVADGVDVLFGKCLAGAHEAREEIERTDVLYKWDVTEWGATEKEFEERSLGELHLGYQRDILQWLVNARELSRSVPDDYWAYIHWMECAVEYSYAKLQTRWAREAGEQKKVISQLVQEEGWSKKRLEESSAKGRKAKQVSLARSPGCAGGPMDDPGPDGFACRGFPFIPFGFPCVVERPQWHRIGESMDQIATLCMSSGEPLGRSAAAAKARTLWVVLEDAALAMEFLGVLVCALAEDEGHCTRCYRHCHGPATRTRCEEHKTSSAKHSTKNYLADKVQPGYKAQYNEYRSRVESTRPDAKALLTLKMVFGTRPPDRAAANLFDVANQTELEGLLGSRVTTELIGSAEAYANKISWPDQGRSRVLPEAFWTHWFGRDGRTPAPRMSKRESG